MGYTFLIPTIFWELPQIRTVILNNESIIAVLFLGFFPSYLAYLIWNISIRKIGLKITSNLVLFSPIVSIAVGIIWLNEAFTGNLIISTITIIIGAFLTSHSQLGEEF
jgi:drug/metabolite transporter (DMT)-like permease